MKLETIFDDWRGLHVIIINIIMHILDVHYCAEFDFTWCEAHTQQMLAHNAQLEISHEPNEWIDDGEQRTGNERSRTGIHFIWNTLLDKTAQWICGDNPMSVI